LNHPEYKLCTVIHLPDAARDGEFGGWIAASASVAGVAGDGGRMFGMFLIRYDK
jgi:hypothetical protein